MDNNESKPTFNQLPIVQQAMYMVLVSASVAIGFFIVLWSQEPMYRPLINDIAVVDASKAVDLLELENIEYSVDVHNRILYVESSLSSEARLILAKAGFDMELPDRVTLKNLSEQEDNLLHCINSSSWNSDNLIYQSWFQSLIKQLLGLVSIWLLIICVLRPVAINIGSKGDN